MYENIDNFIEELKALSHEYLPESEIETIYKRTGKVSLRIVITTYFFIDVYANIESNRYDFSLIKDNERIFGYDNLETWHYHPLNKQNVHIVIEEPTLSQIFYETAKVINAL